MILMMLIHLSPLTILHYCTNMVSDDSHIMIELKQTLWSLAFSMSRQLMMSTA